MLRISATSGGHLSTGVQVQEQVLILTSMDLQGPAATEPSSGEGQPPVLDWVSLGLSPSQIPGSLHWQDAKVHAPSRAKEAVHEYVNKSCRCE